MAIDVRNNYESWVGQYAVPLFETAGITVTPHARNLLAYAMHCQVEEGLVKDDDILLQRAERFCKFAVPMYRRRYGTAEMNFNRAVHLFIDLTCA